MVAFETHESVRKSDGVRVDGWLVMVCGLSLATLEIRWRKSCQFT